MSHAGPVEAVTVRVPGKLNLHLAVGPARADGFHELSTVFHAVSIYDHVTARPAQEWSVQVSGPYADKVPTGRTNLALAAAKAIARRRPRGLGPARLRIDIDKQIPVAGGMAGGSADAAATLLACRELWELEQVDNDTLGEIAAGLGSDVPFVLHGGTVIGSGRGEQLTPILARGELHWVLWVGRGKGLSTPAVYAECDRLRAERGQQAPVPQPSQALMTALRQMQPEEVGRALRNDLQDAAVSLKPTLAKVLEMGNSLGALGGVVSGSGPTVAFLVTSATDALDLSVGLAANGPTGDILRATGPVAGAQVVPGGPNLNDR